MPTREEVQRLATELSKKLADEGRLIEAGWLSYRAMVIHPNAPQVQIDECRFAFMAGAQHLFGSIMSILSPGPDETESDLSKMNLIDKELNAFTAEMALRINKAEGSA